MGGFLVSSWELKMNPLIFTQCVQREAPHWSHLCDLPTGASLDCVGTFVTPVSSASAQNMATHPIKRWDPIQHFNFQYELQSFFTSLAHAPIWNMLHFLFRMLTQQKKHLRRKRMYLGSWFLDVSVWHYQEDMVAWVTPSVLLRPGNEAFGYIMEAEQAALLLWETDSSRCVSQHSLLTTKSHPMIQCI